MQQGAIPDSWSADTANMGPTAQAAAHSPRAITGWCTRWTRGAWLETTASQWANACSTTAQQACWDHSHGSPVAALLMGTGCAAAMRGEGEVEVDADVEAECGWTTEVGRKGTRVCRHWACGLRLQHGGIYRWATSVTGGYKGGPWAGGWAGRQQVECGE